MQFFIASGLAALAALAPSTQDADPEPRAEPVQLRTGDWSAMVAKGLGDRLMVFGLRVEAADDGWRASLLNGEEVIPVRMTVEANRFRIDLDPYQSWIEGGISETGDAMGGEWIRPRGNRPTVRMKFYAGVDEEWREAMPHLGAGPDPHDPKVDGRWSVRFEDSEDPAIAVFEVRQGTLHGTFLTTLGDYRYLSGQFDGKKLYLSCFDGAHAFAFHGEVQDDGTLAGTFLSRDTYKVAWTARRDPKATLPDPFGLTEVDPDAPWGELAFSGADGKPVRLDDKTFAGRARILALFGTWCPNCTDHAKYLNELEERYGERGLSILGIAFEYDDDAAVQRDRIASWKERLGVEHPVLLGGPADKQRAHRNFPILSAVRAYPTTIFIGPDGRIDGVHTGFSGPATGVAHERLRDAFEARIERLLGPADGAEDPPAGDDR